jgi:hypothetical protein
MGKLRLTSIYTELILHIKNNIVYYVHVKEKYRNSLVL